jgi:hypothetical protein
MKKLNKIPKDGFNFGSKVKYCYLCNVNTCGISSRIVYKEFVIYMLSLLKTWLNKPFYNFQFFLCTELALSVRVFLCKGNAGNFFEYDNCDGFVDLSKHRFGDNTPSKLYFKDRLDDEVVISKKKVVNGVIDELLSLLQDSEIIFVSPSREKITFKKNELSIKKKAVELEILLFEMDDYITL